MTDKPTRIQLDDDVFFVESSYGGVLHSSKWLTLKDAKKKRAELKKEGWKSVSISHVTIVRTIRPIV